MRTHLLCSAVLVLALVLGGVATGQAPTDSAAGKSGTVDDTYPGLASAGLVFATLGELPENVLFRSGEIQITTEDLDAELAKAPENVREGLKKNLFFLIEQMATKRLLLDAAKRKAADAKKDAASMSEQDLFAAYFEDVTAQIQVSDEEVSAFYEANKDACGGASLEDMKSQIKPFVLKEKQQEAAQEHIRGLGKSTPIVVAASWVKEQAAAAKDNPVDQARASGKPSMVDFGASGCRPCEMMVPILEDLKRKYEGKANVLFVHVREQQILASRYGIQSIPVQVFFDKDGKEVFRHTGFFAQAECEKKMAELGVQ